MCLFIFICALFVSFGSVKADDVVPREVLEVLDGFLECLEDNEACVYNYTSIDSSLVEDATRENLYEIKDLDYEVYKTKKNEYGYEITIKFDAEGRDWNVSGFKAVFYLSMEDGVYKITDTDFFDNIGTDAVTDLIFRTFGIIGGFIIGIIIFVIIVVMAIVLIVVALPKKNVKCKEVN